ncbi:outer dense fiber protein 3-like protein 2 [Drosophila obscura]|uniref:outer dense fiber protein 3-like protein 2 n=1 Tax=Drosophila obscura TaxID=7282 RepID=UPI001BB1F0CE|nr:outer dense fiber protein 3-like protein 2 [Drosophila obscura]
MSRNFGPGPGAYMLPSQFGQGAGRGPQYSFGRRTDYKNTDKAGPGPGPAAYKIDKVTRYGRSNGLQFSMLERNPIKPTKIRYD